MAFEIANRDDLGTESVSKLLLKYSVPSIISMVVVSLYNIVDRIFIGHGVGPLAISGLALTFPLMSLVTAIGTLVGVGSATRISIVLGMKDLEWANRVAGNAIILNIIFSTIFITISVLFMDYILVQFGGSENTISYAKDYLIIVIPGSIFQNISFGFSNMMKASGYPTKAMSVILLGMIVNVILDPILIFGFGLGIKGAAIATVISMFISACYALSHFLSKKSYVRFYVKYLKLRTSIVKNIVSVGMSPFLMNATSCLVMVIMNKYLLEYGGDLAVGAFGIINSYGIFTIMFVFGICQGMQPIVGYNLGARKIKRVKDALLLSIKASVIAMTVGFIFFQALAGVLVGAFTSDEELIVIATKGLRICFAVYPIIGFQIVVANFFQSISKAKISIFMSLSRQLIFLIPALIISTHFFGLIGVWLALPISDALSAVVAYIFIRREKLRTYQTRGSSEYPLL